MGTPTTVQVLPHLFSPFTGAQPHRDEKYKPSSYSFGGMEGYLNARVLVEVFRRMGNDFTADKFRETVEGTSDLDAGIDAPVTFGPDHHQGLEKVYFTTVIGGEWAPMPDLSVVPLPR